MPNELRTPLNSLLILARLLADNPDGNLNSKQIDFAKTIHSSGQDLLTLINDILDLSKIEAGMMTISLGDVSFREVSETIDRGFRQLAVDKGLDFDIDLAPNLPASIHTDATRLQQVLKNLLGNAFKFTSNGGGTLREEGGSRGRAQGPGPHDPA